MGKGSRFSDTYKREAVAKAETSGNVSQTAREFGISDKTLHGWKNKWGTSKVINVSETKSADLAARVERQLAVRDEQVEVFKKAISIVSQHEETGSI